MLLNACADSLTLPLKYIFNKSLSSEVFPARWKTSYTTPIFKSGSRNCVKTYWSVAIVRKAFDRINHTILLSKLNKVGIYSSLLNWIESYLIDRSQYVKMSGNKSQPFIVFSGVPQGSHLGPLFFILFMNDVTDIFYHSRCVDVFCLQII